jgi:hypothetical protein
MLLLYCVVVVGGGGGVFIIMKSLSEWSSEDISAGQD